MATKLSSEMARKFAIISALARMEKPTLNDLVQRTGIPEPSLKRQLVAIRNEFRMKIPYVRDKSSGLRGTSGYYTLLDWGVIDREEFLMAYGGMTL